MTDYSDDSSTIRDVLAGDVDAYGRIVKKYQKPIYNLMVRMTHSEQIAMVLVTVTGMGTTTTGTAMAAITMITMVTARDMDMAFPISAGMPISADRMPAVTSAWAGPPG